MHCFQHIPNIYTYVHVCACGDQLSTKTKALKAMSLIKSAVSGAQLMSNKNVAKQHYSHT